MRRLSNVLIAVIVLALMTAACGDDDAGMTTEAASLNWLEAPETTAAPATTEAPAMTEALTQAPLPGGSDDGESEALGIDAVEAATALNPADLGRLIVYTASIAVEVDDVVTAGEEAQAAVAGLGGVLFGQETTTGDHPRSILTIKVPPENFQAALERLSGVGKLLSQSVFADDVTERVVDLQSQITTSEASVERLRAFLAGATDLKTVARFEAELLSRETQLEVLRGRLRTLEGQVSLATIVLILTEPVPDVPEPSLELIQTGYEGHDEGAGCPGADDLRIDEDADYTVCITVTNNGDTLLSDLEVRDPGLRADPDDFALVSGSLDTPLPPEGSLIFIFEGTGDPRRSSTDPSVTATAIDADGDQIRVKIARSVERLRLRVDADDSLPGFTDGLEAAWNGVQRIIGVAVVVTGVLIPFLWLPILAAAAIWYWRRRKAEDEPEMPPSEPEPPASDGS